MTARHAFRDANPETGQALPHDSHAPSKPDGPSRVLAATGGLFFLILALASSASAREPIDLDRYARILEEHTQETNDRVGVRVDYRGIKADARWKDVVADVERAKPSALDRKGKLAYWINAYNILTIDLILQHYPVESIKDIGSFFSPVWNIEVAKIEGRSLSLGEIEHEILRKMGEPRIHAAIVCASTSCPPLARTPFHANRLDQDLAKAMRTWLTSPTKGIRIDRKTNRITLSKIFDWFEEDFEAKGGVLEVITPNVRDEDASWLRDKGSAASIGYFGYDWSLNDVR